MTTQLLLCSCYYLDLAPMEEEDTPSGLNSYNLNSYLTSLEAPQRRDYDYIPDSDDFLNYDNDYMQDTQKRRFLLKKDGKPYNKGEKAMLLKFMLSRFFGENETARKNENSIPTVEKVVPAEKSSSSRPKAYSHSGRFYTNNRKILPFIGR